MLLPAENPGPMTGRGQQHLPPGRLGRPCRTHRRRRGRGTTSRRHRRSAEDRRRSAGRRLRDARPCRSCVGCGIVGATASGCALPQIPMARRRRPIRRRVAPVEGRRSSEGRRRNADRRAHARPLTRSRRVLARDDRYDVSRAISWSPAAAWRSRRAAAGISREYLASLERVRALDPLRLLPAHGPEITDPESASSTVISSTGGCASGRCWRHWRRAEIPCSRSRNLSMMDLPRR